MGSIFDEDEAFDLAAIEARHMEMEAEEQLELDLEELSGAAQKGEIFPESDWEATLEAVLFTMGNSVELGQLAVAIGQSEKVAKRVAESLQKRYEEENRGMQILELEGAYQMSTRVKYYENLIRVASAPKKHMLTEVALETLSIIAYKQPVTKLEISRIRGVSSDHAVNRLVEYGLVCEVGRLDAPGRPAQFATTEEFLRRFGVGSVTDLPTVNPEQEGEIIQEVEEELQLKLNIDGTLEENDPGEDPEGESERDPGRVPESGLERDLGRDPESGLERDPGRTPESGLKHDPGESPESDLGRDPESGLKHDPGRAPENGQKSDLGEDLESGRKSAPGEDLESESEYDPEEDPES